MAWTLEGGRLVAGNSMQVGFEWAESGTYKGLRVNPKYNGIHVVQARPVPLGGDGLSIFASVRLQVTEPSLHFFVTGFTYFVTVTNLGGTNQPFELVGVKQ